MQMPEIYVLKIYDISLVKFKVELNEFGQMEYVIIDTNNKYRNLFPIGFDETDIGKWLGARLIPKNREFVNEILKSIGNPSHPMGIIKVTFGLSVTDAYWIVPDGFTGTFKNYNLFENEFTKALELVAFTGYNTKIRGIATSPEFTTNGMLKKCWRRIDNKLYLYKGGTFGAANTGLEPYSEYYAYQIAEKMGLKTVKYGLKQFKKQLVSVCETFTDINTSYVPIWLLLKTDNIQEKMNILGRDNFTDMVIFDAVICNTDRHTGNYGLLRDNKTGELKSVAPIFDNGLSLFNYAMRDDFEDIQSYAKTRINAFNADQVTMAKSLMTDRQRAMLRKLINFKFVRHPSYNLPEWRLKALEDFVQYRIRELLQE
jgi:HipA-like C-terminal domain.